MSTRSISLWDTRHWFNGIGNLSQSINTLAVRWQPVCYFQLCRVLKLIHFNLLQLLAVRISQVKWLCWYSFGESVTYSSAYVHLGCQFCLWPQDISCDIIAVCSPRFSSQIFSQLFFTKWWQLLVPQIMFPFYLLPTPSFFPYICWLPWLWREFLTGAQEQALLFSVFCWIKCQQVTSHVTLVPLRYLTVPSTDQNWHPFLYVL